MLIFLDDYGDPGFKVTLQELDNKVQVLFGWLPALPGGAAVMPKSRFSLYFFRSSRAIMPSVSSSLGF